MRKCLVVIIALMLITITLSPAVGFTFKTEGSKHLAEKSASTVDNSSVSYSFKSGVPAHKLTPEMMANRYSLKSSGVQSTRVPYSFKQGTVVPHSMKLVGFNNAIPLGKQATRATILLGSLNKVAKIEAVETVPVEAVPVEAVPVESNVTLLSENSSAQLPGNLTPEETINLTK